MESNHSLLKTEGVKRELPYRTITDGTILMEHRRRNGPPDMRAIMVIQLLPMNFLLSHHGSTEPHQMCEAQCPPRPQPSQPVLPLSCQDSISTCSLLAI